jgi:DNA-binding LacI/PurR family transcriptional regulator
MAATLRDICRETGLSSATVSRVINNSPLVREDTRERVQEVMEKLNYFPLASARALAGRRTGSIGLISPYVGSGFFSDIMVGVDRVAVERGVHVMMSFAHGVGDEKRLVTRFIKERSVDAVILINLDLTPGFLLESKNDRIPLISVDTPAVEQGIASVSIGNRDGAHKMMEHLLEHGYRDIAVFAGPEISYDSRERIEGCRAAAAAAGVSLPDDKIFTGSFIAESGREFMQKILDSGKPLPDAVFALNDAMAFGAMACLRDAGLSVPKDIAVTGFDESEVSPLVGLTTVAVPLFDMGRHAAEMALDSLNGELEQQHIIVPAELVIRESCGCT